MTVDRFLQLVIAALKSTGIPHMLTGSVASAYHGSSRATMDVDIVIDPTTAQLAEFVAFMDAAGVYVSADAASAALTHRTMFNVVDTDSGWKADLILRKHRPFSTVELDRRERAQVFGVALDVATLEDVVLSKLEWARLGESARQLDDVRTLLRLRGEELDRHYLERWIDVLGVRDQWNAVESSVHRSDDSEPTITGEAAG